MDKEQWEYELFSTSDLPNQGFLSSASREEIRDHLNGLGAQGWEMVNAQFAVVDGSTWLFSAILKRRKPRG